MDGQQLFRDENQVFYFMDVACFAFAKEEVRRCGSNEPIVMAGPAKVFAMVAAGHELMIAVQFENYYGVFGPNSERPTVGEPDAGDQPLHLMR